MFLLVCLLVGLTSSEKKGRVVTVHTALLVETLSHLSCEVQGEREERGEERREGKQAREQEQADCSCQL
jgi:hypothetical protein